MILPYLLPSEAVSQGVQTPNRWVVWRDTHSVTPPAKARPGSKYWRTKRWSDESGDPSDQRLIR
jgi:hypothetical protein